MRSSPRPWGCFWSLLHRQYLPIVFPTPVGVFLGNEFIEGIKIGLPHARGGVSDTNTISSGATGSSPRPWGCFLTGQTGELQLDVFPTPVGVFPIYGLVSDEIVSLPHARGGVSSLPSSKEIRERSSPRPWGCFQSSSGGRSP